MQAEKKSVAVDSFAQPLDVPRVSASALTATQFFEQYRKTSTPVVVTGLFELNQAWDLDFLCVQLGDRVFPVRRYGRDRYTQDKRLWKDIGSSVESWSVPFTQYAQWLNDGTAQREDLYLGKCGLTSTPLGDAAELQAIIHQLNLTVPISGFNLWVGLAGHTTCLHYDPFDGTLIQLHGSKRLVLLPPSQLYNVYPFPIQRHLTQGLKSRSTYSQVYPDRPDLDAFPRFEQALQQRYEVILWAGEVLFIPTGWWHEVTAVGEGVVCSVNRFWQIVPFYRSLQWSKLRAHLGSVLAVPHVVWEWGKAMQGAIANNV
ncbi:MAG: cupin-like domain-containing protein [Leptolyngbyaceae cyanobacterium SL_7_1]|nr:cupin-like domain-containing protein [Leptolyngbyaceae cyanobacterium SL_7_1]